jgi:hypothetical protein
MQKASRKLPSRRAEILAVIREHPGITSGEIAQRLGIAQVGKITTDMWQAIRSERVLTERVLQNGRHVNAYYMPDQITGDSVTKVNQRIVDANDVIPPSLGPDVQTSVFGARNVKSQRGKSRAKASRAAAPAGPTSVPVGRPISASGFACAIASDGTLVLIREGQIQFSLTDAEAATLQSYLMKRAAASLFANMM